MANKTEKLEKQVASTMREQFELWIKRDAPSACFDFGENGDYIVPGLQNQFEAFCTGVILNTNEIESELNKKKENQMTHIEKHINLLGMRVEDRVTGFTGVVTSVGFDLYGCIQAVINPGVDKEGKLQDQTWFDVSRLALMGDNPVIDRPNYESGRQAEGKQGAADKPRMMKP